VEEKAADYGRSIDKYIHGGRGKRRESG